MKIEEGIVVAVFPERATVRVQRQESDDMVSAELRVIFPGTLKNMYYSMPKVDEHVLCVFPDKSTGSKGFVLGAMYSEVSEPPIKNPNKHYIQFEDGAQIEYDTELHVLTVISQGDINVTAKGNATVQATNILLN